MTLIKYGSPSNISPKRVKLQTWNLAWRCLWTISPKWTNKISVKGTPSNISLKRIHLQTWNLVRWCIWTISPKWANKISEKWRCLAHVTLIKFGTPWNISPKRVKLQTLNLPCGCMWIISPKWTNKNSEKGRGLGHVTLIKFGTPSNISPKSVKLQTWNLIGLHILKTSIMNYGNNGNGKNGKVKWETDKITLGKNGNRDYGGEWDCNSWDSRLQTYNLPDDAYIEKFVIFKSCLFFLSSNLYLYYLFIYIK